jgi:hypothetical protein
VDKLCRLSPELALHVVAWLDARGYLVLLGLDLLVIVVPVPPHPRIPPGLRDLSVPPVCESVGGQTPSAHDISM